MSEDQGQLFKGLVAQKPKCNVDPQVLKSVFEHYKQHGFPYLVLTQNEKLDEWVSLAQLQANTLYRDKVFTTNSTGVALANYYHPHRYSVRCGGNKTALETFSITWRLEKCIKKCIALNGSVDDSKLRSMLSIFEGTQVASNFPPGTAKSIYRLFLPDGGRVWDMSCGFGGRLLAALSCRDIKYFGTDPSTRTFEGLKQMLVDLDEIGATFIAPTIFNHGSEVCDLNIPSNSIDFCFTSPPYFNTEKYAEEDTQSFRAYPYKSTWVKKFLGGTADNCYRVLKNGKFCAINIANVKTFPDLEKATVREFCAHGFVHTETYFLAYSMMPGAGSKNKQYESGRRFRTEPIFIFQKTLQGKAE